MMEFLRNAHAGWMEQMTQGKLLALFLLALLVYWFWKRDTEQKALLKYATAAAICCVVPVTAALLMSYQTRFYDYEWIWSIVPVTAVTAYVLTVLLTDISKVEKKSTRFAVLGLCALILFASGNMGEKKEDNDSAIMKAVYFPGEEVKEADVRRDAYEVLEKLQEITAGGEVVLWAPVEIMEYAREVDARVRLLYGRNMWDQSLNGYSYDTCSEEVYDAYHWMTWATMYYRADGGYLPESDEEIPSAETCMQTAKDAGVNCLFLPETTEDSVLELAEKIFGVKARLIEEYWLIYG